jgi:hypothetical protein
MTNKWMEIKNNSKSNQSKSETIHTKKKKKKKTQDMSHVCAFSFCKKIKQNTVICIYEMNNKRK